MRSSYPGLNVQYPISQMILDGSKTIETRTYPLPKDLVGKQMAMIEAPGPTGTFRARVVALIIFGDSFQYQSKAHFYRDTSKHRVTPSSPWKWRNEKGKWGWPIIEIRPLDNFVPAPKKRGIIFTKTVCL